MTCRTEYRIEAGWMPRGYFGSPVLSSGDTWTEVSQALTRTTEVD